MTKFCINCKHIGNEYFPTCHKPEYTKTDFVTGNPKYKNCSWQRTTIGNCKEEDLGFEQAEEGKFTSLKADDPRKEHKKDTK